MKPMAKAVPILILFLLASPVILLKGCGNYDKEEGCPAINTLYSDCRHWAADTDTITGPASGSLTVASGYFGGAVVYAPLQYIVTDSATGEPRNDICIEFYTDGFFYTDRDYTIVAPSRSDMMMNIIMKTSDRGVICAYWTTEDLPPSSTVDLTSDTWVKARSGAISHDFKIDWTVKKIE